MHNATSYTAFINDREAGVFVDYPGNPLYAYNLTLPTLLENHSLNVQVARYKVKIPLPGPARYFTRFVVNGHDVGPYDIPARNGALHVITNLLDPRGHHKEDHKHRGPEHESVDVDWEDWEEWLPQWAMQDEVHGTYE